MSRRPAPANAGSVVSLFPFLAVLLCTIGALLLLLVIIARHSANQAKLEAERAKAGPTVDLAAVAREQEDLDWQVEQLSGSWEKTSQVLVDQRAHLSHLEEHAQRLRTEIAQWEEAQRQLADRKSLDAAAQEKLRAEIEELKRRSADAEAKLTEVKGRVKRTAFAVVPYDGKNGTRRRPIYIECRNDSVVIQPEGIVFTEDDFAGSLGPSNPLAACVRATAEHFARSGNLEPGEQPYPLLLVRPNGIMAYYVARAAMTSWDSEFGYELVDADWTLDYPQVDPQLKQLLAGVQQEARNRQVMIAQAAPSLRSSERVTFSAAEGDGSGDSGNGMGGSGGGSGGGGSAVDAPYVAPRGHVADSGSGLNPGGAGGGQGGGGALSGTTGGPGGGSGGGYGSYADGGVGPRLGSPGGGPADGAAPEMVANPYVNGGQTGGANGSPGGPGMYAGGGQPGQSGSGAMGGGAMGGGYGGPGEPMAQGASNGSGSGTGTGGNSAGGPGQQGAGGANGNGNSGSSNDGTALNGRGSSNSGSSGSGGGTEGDGSSGSSGGGSGSSGSGSSGGSGGGSGSMAGPGSAGGGAADASGGAAGGAPEISVMDRSQSSSEGVDSLAKKRGKDWSLPDAARKKTPVARPVQIYCSGDRLTVMSERNIPDKQINFGYRTADSVDQLVKTVWDQVETWGIAGRNMYWRPTISIHYAPDGAVRFNELRTLLLGSGLEVVGKPIHVAQPIPSPYERR